MLTFLRLVATGLLYMVSATIEMFALFALALALFGVIDMGHNEIVYWALAAIFMEVSRQDTGRKLRNEELP